MERWWLKGRVSMMARGTVVKGVELAVRVMLRAG